MTGKVRIVFAHCMHERWVAPIAGDLEKACEGLPCELFVIGRGANCFITADNYIDLDVLESSIFSALTDSMCYNTATFEEQIHYEETLYQLSGIIISREDIRQRLQGWFSEALLLLKMIQPDIVIVWNGLLARRAMYAKAARLLKLPVYYAEKGLLPDSWYVDQRGINPLSSVAEGEVGESITSEAREKWLCALQMIDEKGESAWEQPARKDPQPLKKMLGLVGDNQKIVFFPGQVDSDSNIILFSNHFNNSLDALAWLVEGLSSREYFVLAKPHPKGSTKTEDFTTILGTRGKSLSDINVIDAIQLSDCVVSINSTVAFEAAIRGKPVLLLGQSLLSKKEFVSTYVPGVGASVQIAQCIERYDQNREMLYQQALALAVYLDSHYYAYRGNQQKTVDLVKRLLAHHEGGKEKSFTLEDVSRLSQKEIWEGGKERFLKNLVSHYDLKNCISGRTLLKALYEKVKDKLLTNKHLLFL